MEVVLDLQRMLINKVGHERYQVWFETGVRFDVEGDVPTIETADQFTLERLRKNFQSEIVDAACAVMGEGCAPIFRVNAELAQRSRQPEAPPTSARATIPLRVPQGRLETRGQDRRQRGETSKPMIGMRRTLANFVSGPANQIASTAAHSIPRELGLISPVYFHGPTGSGKTHLLEGIAQAVRGGTEIRTCVYHSSEQFTCEFLEALHCRGLPSFRRKYRDVDLLLLDDVQFFSRKKATLVEVQHTIDTLIRHGKQVVLAADRPPVELVGFSPELRGRLGGGLVCPVGAPDRATRHQIAQRWAAEMQLDLAPPIFDMLANQVVGDARLLLGALHRLRAVRDAQGAECSISAAEIALADILNCSQRPIRLPDIERAVCDVFDMSAVSLRSQQKTTKVTKPRMLALWLARKYTRAACSEIGDYFGLKSHSSVVAAQKKVERWMEDDAKIPLSNASCRVSDAVRRIEGYLRTG